MLAHKLATVVDALARNDIPTTYISFPRSTTDKDYLFRKLRPIFPKVGAHRFWRAFETIARPDLVNVFKRSA